VQVLAFQGTTVPSRQSAFRATRQTLSLPRHQYHFTLLFDSETAQVDVSVAGIHFASTSHARDIGTYDDTLHSLANMDVPMPTANGGFTHTNSSKAKISAANKGKTPWNKGKERSPQVKALIAAGVRANNRLRFLQKLEQMGMTEEEYESQKEEERRVKEAKSKERMTDKGGYRPTEETKKKLSDILKAKWANGEMKVRVMDPSKARRGFTHSEETKAKISDALKRKWSEDESYREHHVNEASRSNTMHDTRKKISETLNSKWQDPEFRENMMEKMKNRKKPGGELRDASYRNKISEAMNARWQDPEYRNKAVQGIRKRSLEMSSNRNATNTMNSKRSPSSPKQRKASAKEKIFLVEAVQAKQASTNVIKPTRTTTRASEPRGEYVAKAPKVTIVKAKKEAKDKPKEAVVKSAKKEPDGSINRLREERRDLFDLLYGDEPEEEDVDSAISIGAQSGKFGLEDRDLNAFDPYGLEDH